LVTIVAVVFWNPEEVASTYWACYWISLAFIAVESIVFFRPFEFLATPAKFLNHSQQPSYTSSGNVDGGLLSSGYSTLSDAEGLPLLRRITNAPIATTAINAMTAMISGFNPEINSASFSTVTVVGSTSVEVDL
jgi:hypothetical protein